MTRVLLAEDVQPLARALKHAIDRVDGLHVVALAHDGMAAVQLAAETQPDILLMDSELPHLDGMDAVDEILAVAPTTRVVYYTGSASAQHVERATSQGAWGVLHKRMSVLKVAEVIAAVARGERPAPITT